MLLRALLTIAVGYLLGNLNGAVLISRWIIHDDVRTHGSGNAGFTNFFRNYGGIYSAVVVFIDAAKAVAACLIGRYLFAQLQMPLEGSTLGAMAVALGHDFPALLGFRGGKGIMCGCASAFVMDWRSGLIILSIFTVCYLLTQYVSLGSIMGAVALAVSFALFHWDHPAAAAMCCCVSALAIFMHRENISRLLHGTERKTYFFKREKKG